MDLDAFRWLLTPPGQRLLDQATRLLDDGVPALKAGERLRRDHGGDRVATALGQVDLRGRARAKFGDLAASMYFTPDGLEQATRLPVASHRAARMTAAAPSSLIDLGCGIGGDLVAFAAAGITCAGVDLDPVRVEVARANLAALELPGAVQEADALDVDTSPFAVAFADPARRTGAGRRFDPEAWVPPWSFVEGLLAGAACVKVAPGVPHELVPDGVEAEWVSDRGEVKEAALWSGPLATTTRRATVLGATGLASVTAEEAPEPAVRPLGDHLYEPDGAVVRAGLVTAVAAEVGGGLLDEHIAYVTGDAAHPTPFATGYRVLEELPYREKQLRAALRERGVGTLEIKKRGVDVRPEDLRPRLQLSGPESATLVLTRVAGRGTALLVQRLP